MEVLPSPSESANENVVTLENEIKWFRKLLELRYNTANEKEIEEVREELNIPILGEGYYALFLNEKELRLPDRVLLLSLLLPEIKPSIYTIKGEDNQVINFLHFFSQTKGIQKLQQSIRPDLHTILFILAGNSTSAFIKYHQFFNEQSVLLKEQVITFKSQLLEEKTQSNDGQFTLSVEYLNHLLHGTPPRPDFGKSFPASVTTTALSWEDLVVKPYVLKELDRISNWYVGGKRMIESAGGKINGSFPCLFYGSSGAGKTLAVQLLGKKMGVDVFRIDLSMVVSKYIGETEKNLAYLFDRAKGRDWILLFDEADALFGKRTDIKDSKDKWANLEMSYLLQRMEEHQGLTILTTNLRNNLDMALTRRFQSVLYFQRPDKEERKQLWQKLMPLPYTYPHDIAYDGLAHYDLTGADISNVLKAACLDAECRNTRQISSGDLMEAIKREFAKDNRTIN